MNFFEFIRQDWQANAGNTKGRMVLFLFRMANFCATRPFYYYIGFPYLLFYQVFVGWFLGIELPWNTKIGRNFRLFHGQALVVHHKVVIGENCTLRHSTTIGDKQLRSGGESLTPVLGNHVDVGSNVCIVGKVEIGDHVWVGCGTVVVKDVPSHSVIVGNPGSVIKGRKGNEVTN